MTCYTTHLSRECVNALGIPVDDLTLGSAVDSIMTMAHKRDGRTRVVATLNVDFLVNSLTLRAGEPRHPELLDVLRSADLVTADGFPILWLSRILGRPLQERVCGSDLAPLLAERAAREGLSLYLLGGKPGSAKAAAEILEAENPGLRIAGVSSPMVHVQGEALEHCELDDEAVTADINESGADILLVGFGNPKQEIWLNRNRSKLQVPVGIGVGGTFEFICGQTKRAPRVWQQLNLEWVYRVTQDPKRLWRRYAVGLGKLTMLSAPVVAARMADLLTRQSAGGAGDIEWQRLWNAKDQHMRILSVPKQVDQNYLKDLVAEIGRQSGTGDLKVLDFSAVDYLPMAAHPYVFSLASQLRSNPGEYTMMGVSKKLASQLRRARLLDLLSASAGQGIEMLSQKITDTDFDCRTYALPTTSLIFLSGRVSREALASIGFSECLRGATSNRQTIVDMRGVTLLESSAIAELMPFLRQQREGMPSLLLSGVSQHVARMLSLSELGRPIHCLEDTELLTYLKRS